MRKQVSSVFRQAGLFEHPEVKQDVKPPVPAPKIDFACQNFAYKKNVMHYYQLIHFTDTEKNSGTVQSYAARDVPPRAWIPLPRRQVRRAWLLSLQSSRSNGRLHLLRDDGIETLDYEDAHIRPPDR